MTNILLHFSSNWRKFSFSRFHFDFHDLFTLNKKGFHCFVYISKNWRDFCDISRQSESFSLICLHFEKFDEFFLWHFSSNRRNISFSRVFLYFRGFYVDFESLFKIPQNLSNWKFFSDLFFVKSKEVYNFTIDSPQKTCQIEWTKRLCLHFAKKWRFFALSIFRRTFWKLKDFIIILDSSHTC